VGGLTQVTLVHASRYVLSDTLYEFNRGELEVSKYYPLSRRSVLAWRIRGGVILPQRVTLSGQSTQFVPPDQRFYAGGPNSVRGYARNGLGPRVYVSDSFDVSGADTTYRNIQASPTGGNTVFTANVELRVPAPIFPDRVRVGVFVDVGQVWERGDTLSRVSGLRVTPGLGVRFVTPLGPVRLDAAYDGYPPEAGRLYFLNTKDKSITPTERTVHPALSPGFWRRVVVQFAVGQAF
jgi:outer membrane protein assembly factor BamA